MTMVLRLKGDNCKAKHIYSLINVMLLAFKQYRLCQSFACSCSKIIFLMQISIFSLVWEVQTYMKKKESIYCYLLLKLSQKPVCD